MKPEKWSIHSGMRLPFFGKKGVSLFKLLHINRMVRVLNALLNARVVNGPSNAVIWADGNVVFQIGGGSAYSSPGSTGDGDPGDPGLSNCKPYTLTAHMGDYLVATDPATSESVKIAKLPKLRFSVASEVIDGVTHNYSAHDNLEQTRLNVWGALPDQRQTDIIVPRYIIGQTIFAEEVTSTGVEVDGTELTLLQRQDGHAWSRINGDRFVDGDWDLPADESTGTVTGLDLQSDPLRVWLQFSGGEMIYAVPTGSLTRDGFSYTLSAKPTSAAKLSYLISVT